MEAERERCIRRGGWAVNSRNRRLASVPKTGLGISSKALWGSLTIGSALLRGRFSPETWHFGRKENPSLSKRLAPFLSLSPLPHTLPRRTRPSPLRALLLSRTLL